MFENAAEQDGALITTALTIQQNARRNCAVYIRFPIPLDHPDTARIALLWPCNATAAALRIRLPRVRWTAATSSVFPAVLLANIEGRLE